MEFVALLTGTSQEELLQFASGLQPPVIRAHVCGTACDQRRSNQDLAHLVSFRKVPAPGDRTWEENFKESDENAELRRRQEEWEAKRREEIAGEKDDSSTSRDKAKKKKKKKGKEKKVRQVIGEKKGQGPVSGDGPRSGPQSSAPSSKADEAEVEKSKGIIVDLVSKLQHVNRGQGRGRDPRRQEQNTETGGPGAGTSSSCSGAHHESVRGPSFRCHLESRRRQSSPHHEPIRSKLSGSKSHWRPIQGSLHAGAHRTFS